MIIFKDDWNKYPNAIIDVKTKNTSFLRLSALYRDMGVSNHLFPLQLHDPGLQGVDPYDPNISPEMAMRVAIESKVNFFYFLREVARDPAGSDDDPIMFKANRGVIAAYFCFFTHILFILTMIRQTGKSFGIDYLYSWLMNIRLTKSEISVITKDEKLRGREVERLKGMELTIPYYLKQRSSKDPGNTEVIRISALQNTFKLYVPNRSPKIADLIGRGMTSPIVGADELAYLPNNFITIPVMLSTSLAARDVSRMKNEPYGTIFTTTSGKRDTPEGRYAYNLVSDAAVWDERFFDAPDQETLEAMVIAASPGGNLHMNCTFSHRQLGFTDEWLRKRLKEAMVEDPIQAKADFLNEWPSGTTTTPFSQEIADAIRASEMLDNFIEICEPEPYALRWYYHESEIAHKMRDPHILGIDPSEAVNRDAIGLVLMNAITGETAMAADISEANLIHFSKWLSDFLQKYLTVTAIIERKSTGATIIDYLTLYLPLVGIDPFTRIYNQVVQFSDEYPDRFKEIERFHANADTLLRSYKALFGWSTSASGTTSRTALYSRTLNAAAKMTAGLMRDRKLILQTLGLEIKNGRVDHGDGEHDDLVIAWLLCYWLLSLGRNLRHYGLDPSKILVNNPVYQKDIQEVSAYDQMLAMQTRQRVEELTQQLKDEKDEYVARRLEYDLELAISKLTERDRKMVAADDLITKLREERTRSVRPNLGYYGQSEYGSSGLGGYYGA